MPPAYVKAYVERNKNDAADAEAICEVVTRPTMRFVPVKDAEQQSVLMLHRGRSLLVRQRTMLVNALRAHMVEFGITAPQGLVHVEYLATVLDDDGAPLPELARSILRMIVAQYNDTSARMHALERQLAKRHRSRRTLFYGVLRLLRCRPRRRCSKATVRPGWPMGRRRRNLPS
jgi:transposase